MRILPITPTLALLFLAAPLPSAGADQKTASVAPAARELRAPLAAEGKTAAAAHAAREPKSAAAPQFAAPTSRPPLARVLHERDAQGAELARGERYKARFDADGATCIPFLGSAAERNYPVRFQAQGLTVAGAELALGPTTQVSRADETVELERGALREQYATSLGGLEQSFVIPELPARGEIVLSIGVETELAGAQGAGGIEFSNELGGVRYGAATAIDASGRSIGAETVLAGDAIEIRVPAEFVERAVLPLTIDPLISTFMVSGGTPDDIHPDVAYEATNDRYLVVWEEVYSASDHDIFSAEYDGNGGLVPGGDAIIDGTVAFWANPRAAAYNSAHTFLVVAEVGDPAGGARSIQGRICSVVGNTPGPVLAISGNEIGDKTHPDVSGDGRANGSANYCVVWERTYSPTDHDIHGQWLSPGVGNKQFPNTVLIDDSSATLDRYPSIPKACSNTGLLNIVWEREVTPNDHDIHGARYGASGLLFVASTPIYVSTDDTRYPSASAGLDGSGHWLLAFQLLQGADWDIAAALVNGTSVIDAVDVSMLESYFGSNAWSEEQRNVCAGSDGLNFVVAYSESYAGSATDYDVCAATLGEVHDRLFLSEGHVDAGGSPTLEDRPRLCSARGGGGAYGPFFMVWQDTGSQSNAGDILAARYVDRPFTPFCLPSLDTGPCPCGNQPAIHGRGCDNSGATGGATLSCSGSPSIASDSVQFTTSGERASATSVVLQGNATADVVFGQGRRCVGGSLKRLYVKTASGGSISAPAPGDPSVHLRSAALGDPFAAGDTRYYMVYYRDPNVLGGCSAASTFNATPSGALTWRP